MASSNQGPSLGSRAGKTSGGSVRLHPEVVAAQARDILSVLLLFRFVNALCVRTFFQPDEYFQALEPAWNLAFGEQSGAWLTWVFPPLQALILVALPKLVQSVFAALSDFYTWKLAGKIFGDQSTSRWSALWVTVFNPWLWYCSTRTFSNSLETTLTVVALYYWPWEVLGDAKEDKEPLSSKPTINSLRLSLFLAAIAVLLRPTNIFIWLAILTLALTRMTLDGASPLGWSSTTAVLTREIVLCGLSALAVSVLSDRLYFGFWAFPPYTWLHFNLTQSLAVLYGEMPWHYYLVQGIPLLTITFLPFVLVGLFKSAWSPSPSPASSILQTNTLRTLAFVVLSMIGTLSVISHKEVRFIYPLLPALHVLAAPTLTSFFTEARPTPESQDPNPLRPSTPTTLRHKFFLANVLSINLIVGTYLTMFHQPAAISVVHFLRWEFEHIHPDRLDLHLPSPLSSFSSSSSSSSSSNNDDDSDPLFALFLTPCHTTPWRSHLVYPRLRARALTCEPPLHTAPGSVERAAYVDETDRFYALDGDKGGGGDEVGSWGWRFLDEEIWPVITTSEGGGEEGERDGAVEGKKVRGGEMPRYIIGFEGIESMLVGFFSGEGAVGADLGVNLTRKWSAFNGLFNEEPHRRGRLVVWDTGVDASRKYLTGE